MNNKGFMMAEIVVVATVVMVFLTGLYFSYNKLFSLYNTRINYYDSAVLYDLVYYRDMLIRDSKMNSLLGINGSAVNDFKDIFNITGYNLSHINDNDRVYLIHNSMQKIDRSTLSSVSSINPSYLDYVDYLATSIEFKSNYIMVMERCDKDESNDYVNCRYAYLEVYDGKEED